MCLSVCDFVLVFFSPFSIAITSLGEERANLSALRTFVRLVLSVSSSSWGLGRAAVCDCGTPWTFLLPFSSVCICMPNIYQIISSYSDFLKLITDRRTQPPWLFIKKSGIY